MQKQLFLFVFVFQKDQIGFIWNTGRGKMKWFVQLRISNLPCSLLHLGVVFNDDQTRWKWMEQPGFSKGNCLIPQHTTASLLARFTRGKTTATSYHVQFILSFHLPCGTFILYICQLSREISNSQPSAHVNSNTKATGKHHQQAGTFHLLKGPYHLPKALHKILD